MLLKHQISTNVSLTNVPAFNAGYSSISNNVCDNVLSPSFVNVSTCKSFEIVTKYDTSALPTLPIFNKC